MHFEGEFRVPGKADEVIHRFADVPRMARCVPGAVLEQQAEDGSWPGAMVVSFGPKKISFKGRVTCEFDFAAKTGALHGRGAADMRAARIGVKVAFALRDDAGRRPTRDDRQGHVGCRTRRRAGGFRAHRRCRGGKCADAGLRPSRDGGVRQGRTAAGSPPPRQAANRTTNPSGSERG